MNENFDGLRSTLMGLGFGVDPNIMCELEGAIELDQQEFALYAETRFDDSSRIVAKLYITAPDQGQAYLTKYDARLYYSVEPVRNRHYTFTGGLISFKEAFNMLQGRAVYKTITTRFAGTSNAWLCFDFDEKDAEGNYALQAFSDRYGFDLEKCLVLYPIAELADPAKKEDLLKSLQQGNLAPVIAVKKSKTERWMIAANPAYKTINIFTSSNHHPSADLGSPNEGEQ